MLAIGEGARTLLSGHVVGLATMHTRARTQSNRKKCLHTAINRSDSSRPQACL
jgi:hypothetical protein